ncbi:MAG: lipoprotein-releasing ABC transporter permease subunit [SAR86 cluster bacterium]|jgi:lipoprotein-releasing system permease protein|nr:lipoprotein-releasing ABC transporter permease subunit [SAR86 cluster bacterium]
MNLLSLSIAFRYFRSKRRGFLSFTSIMSFVGITLGVTVLILVTSVMNGFEKELKQRVLQAIPHANIQGQPFIDDWKDLIKKTDQQVLILGSSPFIETQGLINSSDQLKGVIVYGVHPDLERTVSTIPNHIIVGNWDSLNDQEYNIAIGDILAMQLRVNIGDFVNLLVPDTTMGLLGTFPRTKRFKVSTIFSIGSPEIDQSFVFINLNKASKLLRTEDKVHGLRIKYSDLFIAKRQIKEDVKLINQLNDQTYTSNDWTNSYGTLFKAIQMEKFLVSLLLFTIILVAAFNLVSTLVMIINEKKSQIAILLTLGATRASLGRVFIFFGAIVGFVGTLSGLLLGLLFTLNLGTIINFLEESLGMHLLDAYFINYFPIDLRPTWIIVICLISFLLAIVSSLYPANLASKLEPAEVLRYE